MSSCYKAAEALGGWLSRPDLGRQLVSVGMSPITAHVGEVYEAELLFVVRGEAGERKALT